MAVMQKKKEEKKLCWLGRNVVMNFMYDLGKEKEQGKQKCELKCDHISLFSVVVVSTLIKL